MANHLVIYGEGGQREGNATRAGSLMQLNGCTHRKNPNIKAFDSPVLGLFLFTHLGSGWCQQGSGKPLKAHKASDHTF